MLEIQRSQLQPLFTDSPVLKALLEGSFSESAKKEATLNSVSKETFEILLKYTYTGSKELLTSTVILDVLEAGCFLLNPFIIQASLAKLSVLLKENNWDNTIHPVRLVDLTLNNVALLKTINVNLRDLLTMLENSLKSSLNEVFEGLQNSTPSLFNFYTSSFDLTLKKWNTLVSAIQSIETKLSLNLET